MVDLTRRIDEKIVKYVAFEAAMPLKPPFGVDDVFSVVPHNAFDHKISDIGFYVIRDAQISGRGFIHVDGQVLLEPDVMPQYVRDMVVSNRRDDFMPDSSRKKTVVKDLAILVTAEAHLIYGHWLLDYIPRLWLLRRYFRAEFSELVLLLPHDAPQYAKTILQLYLPGINIKYWDWFTEDLSIDKLILPSMLHNSHVFHPRMNEFVNDAVNAAVERTNDARSNFKNKLFVSRGRFSVTTSYRRTLRNQGIFQEYLISRGFQTIYPEELSWEEQIYAFSKAEVLVGEAGSGLHNAIFSPSGTRVLSLRPVNHVQSGIAALRGHRMYYLMPSVEEANDQGTEYEYDLSKLGDALNLLN